MNIKIASTEKALSSNGGLFFAKKLLENFSFRFHLKSSAPDLEVVERNSFEKFAGLTLGLVAGAECLDDMDKLGEDPVLQELCRPYTSKSYGNYLRSFSVLDLVGMQNVLLKTSLAMRAEIFGKTENFILDVDSTSNQQYGKKMEGVGFNYKNITCLDTIKAFDEYGLTYHLDVRPGATYSSVGGSEIIEKVFDAVKKDEFYKSSKRFFRGDSAFCTSSVFESCFVNQAKFVITFKQNMFTPVCNQITQWHSSKEMLFYDGRECEIGETVYQPEDSHRVLRIVAIRAEKAADPMFPDYKEYDYYAWCTNIGSEEWSPEEVILFYRKRGNAENFIRELKYGFDLKHYPCLKLSANKAYGLIAAFAHSIMRYLSLTENKLHPHFAKKTRLRIITLPCIIVRHAREVIFKFMKNHAEEVKRLLETIKNQHHSVYQKLSPSMLGGRSLTT